MNCLYNLRDWLYECDRFLFLAEVHYHKDDVMPSRHNFNHQFNGSSLDEVVYQAMSQCAGESYCISFDRCVSRDDFIFLKKTLDYIASEKWNSTGIEDILRSQNILHKMAGALTDDIVTAHESKGYPSLRRISHMQQN